MMPSTALTPRSVAELTQTVFGEALSLGAAFARLGFEVPHRAKTFATQPAALWVGSVGYERFKDNRDFAALLAAKGVDRLVDVRELPISRRRGYAKTALAGALAAAGIEYVHLRGLGNPKPYRHLYKSGHVEEGRKLYKRYLLGERRDVLDQLVPLLREKRTVLMCLEHDAAACHRTVIFNALRDDLRLELDVAELG
jgi:hypothetical protein